MQMRTIAMLLSIVVIATPAAQATQRAIPSSWFENATGVYAKVPVVAIDKADYLPGTTRDDVCRVAKVRGTPVDVLYELQAYDPAHHLGLANFVTDGCHVVIFSAVLPAGSPPVRRADLSGYHTARGLRVGSPYADVRRVYGAPRNSSAHFVMKFSASTGKERGYENDEMVDVPEQITIVVDNQRVTSIAVMIDLAVLT